ncbi:MAG TPA: hypothetical protein VEX15_00025 [Nocardioidaceae bacterium]|nr:hypothetical protein [Nocardioidaceae bacterium]
MSTSLKELLTDEVRDLPSAPVPVAAVISDGRRRLWRHRALRGTGAFAAVALAALVVHVVPDGSGSDPAGSGGFEQRTATYATSSTIHYGDRVIDVSPHSVWSFVQTDDGFVFTTESGDVYLADGDTVDQIGDGSDDGLLVADDSGSYVAWVDHAAELVVYDTGTRQEVTRTVAAGEPSDGVYLDDDGPYVVALDGGTVYWRTGKGVVAWDVSTQSGGVLVAHQNQFYVHDVVDGMIAQIWTPDAERPRDLVVSADPNATNPRFSMEENSNLSPSARYLAAGDRFDTDGGIFDVTSGDDVTPTAQGYASAMFVQWIDDGHYVARGVLAQDNRVDLLTCSIADRQCVPAPPSAGLVGEIEFPMGEHAPFGLGVS